MFLQKCLCLQNGYSHSILCVRLVNDKPNIWNICIDGDGDVARDLATHLISGSHITIIHIRIHTLLSSIMSLFKFYEMLCNI